MQALKSKLTKISEAYQKLCDEGNIAAIDEAI